jgi:hypothetical protein
MSHPYIARSVALSHMSILGGKSTHWGLENKHLSASNCLYSGMCVRQNFILWSIIRYLTFFVNIIQYLYSIVHSD